MALYDPQQHRSLTSPSLAGMTRGESAWLASGLALWLLGYPDQALTRSHEALTLAQELSHPFSLALALAYAATAPSVCAGRRKPLKSGPRRPWRSRPSRDLRTS